MRHLSATIAIAILIPLGLPSSGVGVSDNRVEREHCIYLCESPHYLDVVDQTVARTRQALFELTGDTLPYRPSIHIVSNLADFNDLIGGKFPDWGAAAAFPERRLIAIKSPSHFNINRSLEELVAHEYAHLLVSHATGFSSAPRWFEEGVAMYVSAEWSWSDNLAMSKAAVLGQIIDLSEIDNVNRFTEGRAHVAYAESFLAIKFLVHTYDLDVISRFLKSLSAGGSAGEAIYAATGSTELEFASDFKTYLHQQFNIMSLFMDTIFFWLGLSVLVIIGGWMRYRKKQQYYRKWERQERLESTDFDYGDPANPEKIEDDDEPWRT
ncbi:MAG: hypothetical protein JSV52_10310 [Candidatus Zixiibacteriota bacterium]|nr:MAG: hypothetical protein JSV52_10310 [candidate division Zixibacteria bacterium]